MSFSDGRNVFEIYKRLLENEPRNISKVETFLPKKFANSAHFSKSQTRQQMKIIVFSGPYFPAFGLNTKRYGVFLHIQSECRKLRTRKNSVFGHFSRIGGDFILEELQKQATSKISNSSSYDRISAYFWSNTVFDLRKNVLTYVKIKVLEIGLDQTIIQ